MESQNISAGGSNNNNNRNSNLDNNFLSFVNQIFDSIGILPGDIRTQLVNNLSQYTDGNKYLFLNNQDLKQLFTRLLDADNQLNGLISEGGVLKPYMDTIGNSWNNIIQQLGKLQALSILKKINKDDCGPVVDALLGALNQKIGIVNNLIESNLQETSKPTKYQETRVDIPKEYLENLSNSNNASSSNVSSSNVSSSTVSSSNASSSTVPNFILKNLTSNVQTEQPLRLGTNLQSIANNQSAISNLGVQQNIANIKPANSNIAGKKKYFAVGGSDNLYKVKYLKYKQKYLELKNNL